jgi:hypothetical protein
MDDAPEVVDTAEGSSCSPVPPPLSARSLRTSRLAKQDVVVDEEVLLRLLVDHLQSIIVFSVTGSKENRHRVLPRSHRDCLMSSVIYNVHIRSVSQKGTLLNHRLIIRYLE